MLRVFDRSDIEEALACASGRDGAGLLRTVLNDHYALEAPTRSELEEHMTRLCEHAGIPRPRVNELVGDIEVDCMWPVERLIVGQGSA